MASLRGICLECSPSSSNTPHTFLMPSLSLSHYPPSPPTSWLSRNHRQRQRQRHSPCPPPPPTPPFPSPSSFPPASHSPSPSLSPSPTPSPISSAPPWSLPCPPLSLSPSSSPSPTSCCTSRTSLTPSPALTSLSFACDTLAWTPTLLQRLILLSRVPCTVLLGPGICKPLANLCRLLASSSSPPPPPPPPPRPPPPLPRPARRHLRPNGLVRSAGVGRGWCCCLGRTARYGAFGRRTLPGSLPPRQASLCVRTSPPSASPSLSTPSSSPSSTRPRSSLRVQRRPSLRTLRLDCRDGRLTAEHLLLRRSPDTPREQETPSRSIARRRLSVGVA